VSFDSQCRVPDIARRNISQAAMLISHGGHVMHGIIYLVGLIVVILAILSFFGLR
jgi:hypothetical protein